MFLVCENVCHEIGSCSQPLSPGQQTALWSLELDLTCQTHVIWHINMSRNNVLHRLQKHPIISRLPGQHVARLAVVLGDTHVHIKPPVIPLGRYLDHAAAFVGGADRVFHEALLVEPQ